MNKAETKYYFVRYQWFDVTDGEEVDFTTVTDKHPFDWVWEKDACIIKNYNEITEEEYDKWMFYKFRHKTKGEAKE